MNEHGLMTSAQDSVDWVIDHEGLVTICSLTVSKTGWRPPTPPPADNSG